MKRYLFIDIETTGFSAVHDEILEIGLVYVSQDKLEAYSQIQHCKKGIPKHITELTGITPQMMVEQGIHWRINTAFVLENYIKQADIIIGHNFKQFDIRFLNEALRTFDFQIKTSQVYDTLEKENKGVNNKGYSLKDLAKKYKVVQPAHRAKADAITTMGIYIKQNIVVPDVLREFYKVLTFKNN